MLQLQGHCICQLLMQAGALFVCGPLLAEEPGGLIGLL